jgi:two-component system sensor histidine kinase/response regulator
MDGFELIEQVRQRRIAAETTMLMLTSAGQRGDAARCRELGIAAYLTKPVSSFHLISAIRLALGSKAERSTPGPLIVPRLLPAKPVGLHVLLAEDNVVPKGGRTSA